MEPVIAWLTENSDPYIKYLTLKNILGKRVNKKRLTIFYPKGFQMEHGKWNIHLMAECL
jgi:hypothetical protein